jgi:hypothetical protein
MDLLYFLLAVLGTVALLLVVIIAILPLIGRFMDFIEDLYNK